MASSGYLQAAVLLLVVQLLCLGAADADQETGTVIPAESRWMAICYLICSACSVQDIKGLLGGHLSATVIMYYSLMIAGPHRGFSVWEL